ncbi:MAG: ATP-binding protein [Candidatus Sumerlaeota bacterium]|nr:ATP-binding protein [Candidatus Sumerlaeota bacterium]
MVNQQSASYAQALHDLTRRYEQLVESLSLLRQIDELDNPNWELSSIFRRLLEVLANGVKAENTSLMLMTESENALELRAAYSPSQAQSAIFSPGQWEGKKFHLGEGIVGLAAQRKRALRLDDVQSDREFILVPSSPAHIRSLMCFPLVFDDQVIGVLNLSHSEPAFFSLESEKLIEIIAGRITRLIRTHVWRQQALESAEHYRLVAENASDAILVFNSEGRLIDANPAAAQISGIPIEQLLIGETQWRDRIHAHDLFAYEAWLIQEMKSRDPSAIEYRFMDSKGRVLYLEERSSPMYFSSDKPPGAVSFIRDMTQRKRADEALRAASRMEATATLAGGIAHQFNNLMMAVLGNAELLRHSFPTPMEPVSEEHLRQIDIAGQRAAELAHQMLAYARGGKYATEAVNLNNIILDTLRQEERILRPEIRFERDLDPALWEIMADQTQIRHVLTNLLTNAAEAIDGDGKIVLTTRNLRIDAALVGEQADLSPGPYACIAVEDTGCGMSAETRARAFEPFFTTKFQGRGLGLAAAHGIVRNHGGHISVYSELGRGSAFKVYLPALKLGG